MSEIILPTNEERSAVCCLSSVNAEYFDEWSQEESFISDVIRFLDNVLEYFIKYADQKYLNRAIISSKKERNIGLGCMGFHSSLQKNLIPYESALALSVTRRIAKYIYDESKKTSSLLAYERGEPDDIKGSGMRHSTLIAIAPNASTSILLGTSPSIEPLKANAYIHKTDQGYNIVKNRYLVKVLEDKGHSPEEIESIINIVIKNKGSIQDMDIFTDEEKDVFKTAIELDQNWVVEHALHRQEFVDQAQSVNLFFPSEVDISYLHQVHWRAMNGGLKTLYYLRSESATTAKINPNQSECLSCEG